MKKGIENIDFASLGEFNDWTYCPDTEMWYEDSKEVLPEPLKNPDRESDFTCNILIGEYIESSHRHNFQDIYNHFDYLENENDCFDDIGFELHLKSKNYDVYGEFSDRFYYRLADFIEEIKSKEYATIFETEYCDYKFVFWKKPDGQARFSVYSYRKNDKKYLQLIFDVIVEQELLISKLNGIINTFKETIYRAVESYNSRTQKEFRIRRSDTVFEILFPEFLDKAD